jgi:dolichol kinase
MTFNPKFTSFRMRSAGLAVVLWINAFIVLSGRRITPAGIVILAVAALLAAVIPESPGKKPEPEKYHITSP